MEGPTGWVVYLLLGVALAVLLHWGLSTALSTEYPVVTVESDSMRSTLNPGDIVFVKSAEEYEPGDIIIFGGWREIPIIHRVVSRSRKVDGSIQVESWEGFDGIQDNQLREAHESIESDILYVTKGDNVQDSDQERGADFVTPEDVHGREILKVPYLGWIKLGASRLINWISLLFR